MMRSRELSPGAKLVWGRLAHYAGKDGLCIPAVETLAVEVALTERQVYNHLRTLKGRGFIRTDGRFRGGAQLSNSYVFLWHRIFDEWDREQEAKRGVQSTSPSPVQDISASPVNSIAYKESQYKESQTEETVARSGELNSMHWGSPEESQQDGVSFGNLESYRTDRMAEVIRKAEEAKRRLKAARGAGR
jgi:hypothetical protein